MLWALFAEGACGFVGGSVALILARVWKISLCAWETSNLGYREKWILGFSIVIEK